MPALEEKPEIYPDLLPDYLAFCQLSSSRPVGLSGAEALRLSEIFAYMQIFDISGIEERRLFLKRIRILDRAYLDWHQKKQPAKDKPDGKSVQTRGRSR